MANNQFAWCNGTLIEQSAFTLDDLRKQRKRWLSGLLNVIFHHPAPRRTKMVLAFQVMGWTMLPLVMVMSYVDLIVFGGYNMMDTSSMMIFANINAIGGLIGTVMYTMGIMLMIHKNYIEKLVCCLLLPVLVPVISVVEASGVLSGLLFPNKGFDIVRKEGVGVERSLNKAVKGEEVPFLV